MKITHCYLCHSNMKVLSETYDLSKMNEFIQNDGSDYNITDIDSYEYKNSLDLRICFENGSTLFLAVEK